MNDHKVLLICVVVVVTLLNGCSTAKPQATIPPVVTIDSEATVRVSVEPTVELDKSSAAMAAATIVSTVQAKPTSTSVPEPTDAPIPTQAPLPTATLVPAAPANPTATPKPTPTLSPTAVPTPIGFIEPDALVGTPCTDEMSPLLGSHELDDDVVRGWEFGLKHPIGFAEHGCLQVSASDGYPTRSGDSSLRFEVQNGDCNSNDGWDDCTTDRSRHELSQSGGENSLQYDGDEYWYTWSVHLPESPLKQGDSITFLGQFNSDNSARFYIEDFSTGLGFRFNDRNYEFIGRDVLIANELSRSVWTDILIHAIWSTAGDGLIELFINGDLAETLTGPNMDGATQVSFDFGIYNAFISDCHCETMPTQVAYFDELRRGQTREEVELQR